MAPQQQQASSVGKNGSKYTVIADQTNTRRTLWCYIAVWLWIGAMSFWFFFTLFSPFLFMYLPKVFTALVACIITSSVLPINRKIQPRICYKLGQAIMKGAFRYFKMKVIVEDLKGLESCGPAIFALEPHHVLPLSIFAFNDCLKNFGGHKCLGCLTGAAFQVPLMRHMYTWVNATSVDKKNLLQIMKEGYSPIICPGGVQEVCMMDNESECILYLNNRKGFIKLALMHGFNVVPVFTFGLADGYDYIVPRGSFMASLARKIGFMPMAFFGMFGIPLAPPKPCQYINVIAKPITVPQIDEPSSDDINKYHSQYVKEISRVFETYKADYGMGNMNLRVV